MAGEMKRKYDNICNLSVEKACQVLDLFTVYRTKLTMKEIADEFSVTSSTILPILHSLENGGYLVRDEITKQYRLGMRFIEKSSLVISGIDLREQAVDIIKGLSIRARVNTHLGILDDTEVIYIDRYAVLTHSLSASYIGRRVPAYCTAMGKAILAWRDPEEQYRILSKTDLKHYTFNTVIDRAEIANEFAKTRERGYSIDDEEFQMGGYCIGAPVYDSTQNICGAISASVTKIPENMERIGDIIAEVIEAAAEISRRMGYRK